MNLPKPLFAAPARRAGGKTKRKKEKKPRVTAVYNVLSGEWSRPPSVIREEEPIDALAEFALAASRPGAVVHTKNSDMANMLRRLGAEVREDHHEREPDEEPQRG